MATNIDTLAKRVADLEEKLKTLPDIPPEVWAVARDAEHAGIIHCLWKFAKEAFGENSLRGQLSEIAQLDERGLAHLYRDATEEIIKRFLESEECKEFQKLPFEEQTALTLRLTRECGDPTVIQCFRAAMRPAALEAMKWKPSSEISV